MGPQFACKNILFLTLAGLMACGNDGPSPTQNPGTPTAEPTAAPATPTADMPTGTPMPVEGCAAWAFSEAGPMENPPEKWWESAIIYEIFVRSYQDSDGDGIGDLQGVIQRLDHIQSLGANTLWLLPTFPSPSEHGYDVVDFDTTHPDYGGDDALDALIEAAHQRDMKVILDLPLNHSSTQHPWFEASRDPESPYRDYYRWRDDDPNLDNWHHADGDYYYGYFWGGMPDLNYDTPALRQAMLAHLEGWLARGIDGFRLDAARHLVEEGSVTQEHEGTYCALQSLRRTLAQSYPDHLLIGEIWSNEAKITTYLEDESAGEAQDDLLPMAFDFPLSEGLMNILSKRNPSWLHNALEARQIYPDPRMAAPFLTNHDMDRVATTLSSDAEQLKLAAALLLAMPGPPVLYYGEEIGMTGYRKDNTDNGRRTPMQWTAEAPGYGFTTADTPWYPINDDVAEINLQSQVDDPQSIFETYRRAGQIRSQSQALQRGSTYSLTASRLDTFVLYRNFGDEHLLIVANASGSEQGNITVDLSEIWPESGFSQAEDHLAIHPLDITLAQTLEIHSLPAFAFYYLTLTSQVD